MMLSKAPLSLGSGRCLLVFPSTQLIVSLHSFTRLNSRWLTISATIFVTIIYAQTVGVRDGIGIGQLDLDMQPHNNSNP